MKERTKERKQKRKKAMKTKKRKEECGCDMSKTWSRDDVEENK